MESAPCFAVIDDAPAFPLVVRFFVGTLAPRGSYYYLPCTLGKPAHSLAFLFHRCDPTTEDCYRRVKDFTPHFASKEQVDELSLCLLNTRLLPTSVVDPLLVERAPKSNRDREAMFSLDHDERQRLDRQGFVCPPRNTRLEGTLHFIRPEPTPVFLASFRFKEPT